MSFFASYPTEVSASAIVTFTGVSVATVSLTADQVLAINQGGGPNPYTILPTPPTGFVYLPLVLQIAVFGGTFVCDGSMLIEGVNEGSNPDNAWFNPADLTLAFTGGTGGTVVILYPVSPLPNDQPEAVVLTSDNVIESGTGSVNIALYYILAQNINS